MTNPYAIAFGAFADMPLPCPECQEAICECEDKCDPKCQGCMDALITWAKSRKPTVPEVLPVVQSLYRRHGAGCCWHIVLDDGNVDNDSVSFCIGYNASGDCREAECKLLGWLLPRMSRTQRRKLYMHPEKYRASPSGSDPHAR